MRTPFWGGAKDRTRRFTKVRYSLVLMDAFSFRLRSYGFALASVVLVAAFVFALWVLVFTTPSPESLPPPSECVPGFPCRTQSRAEPLDVLAGTPVPLTDPSMPADPVSSVSLSSRSGASVPPPRVSNGMLYTDQLAPGSYDLAVLFESGRSVTRRLELLPADPSPGE